MHGIVYVITPARPTPDVLNVLLSPFGPEGQQYWDEFTLGGCFGGSLSVENTKQSITMFYESGPTAPDRPVEIVEPVEGLQQAACLQKSGIGVDAAPLWNIRDRGPYGCSAIVIDNNWHQIPRVTPVFGRTLAPLFGPMQLADLLRSSSPRAQIEEAIATYDAWDDWVEGRLEILPQDYWLCVVDFHQS